MYTAFAPAERASRADVQRQHEKLAALPFVRDFLDAMPNMAVVLNAERQIVLANKALTVYLHGVAAGAGAESEAGGAPAASLVGQRPGEAFGCLHSRETEGGCGTTPFCVNCGAANAIVNSQRLHALDVQECRLICGEAGARETALDLRIWAQPIEVDGETFTVFSLADISDEKRRAALERIFFHDVMNTAGGVKGLADLVAKTSLNETAIREVAGMMSESADQLIEEISAQRALTAAESGELQVVPQEEHSTDMIDRVMRHFHSFDVKRGKDIEMHGETEEFHFVTDPALLRRVLVNLVKNALEAAPAEGVVTMGAKAYGDQVLFTVHSTTVMPTHVQQQVFQRSFSTKGAGRGLGTYSIKLLTERYLRGRVWFVSTEDEGTTFSVRCPRELAVIRAPS